MVTFIEGESVLLRMHEREDFTKDYLHGINDTKMDIYTSHAVVPKSVEELLSYWESKIRSKDVWLGIFSKETSRHVGNIEISQINHLHRAAKFSIILWGEHGKGLALEASKLILNHAFKKLNLNRVELGVNSENQAAIKLYQKLGFKQEGTLREAFISGNTRHDVYIMSILASEYLTP